MAPVVALASHPCAQTRGDHWARYPGGELLQTREHRVAVDDERQALDDSGVGVLFHRRRQPHDRFAGHHTVGVEHDHMRVAPAPMADEIGDVAGFAAHILAAAPVIETRRRQPRAHGEKGALFRDPDIGIGGVGEEEEVERMGLAGALDVLEDGLHGPEHPRGRFVIDRHHDRRRLAQTGRRLKAPSMRDEPHEADDAGNEPKRQPRKRDDEQNQHRPFERRDRADRNDPEHLMGAIGGERERAAEHGETGQNRPPGAARRDQRAALAGGEPHERLRRHGEGREARHRAAEGRVRAGRPRVPLGKRQAVHR